jgi:hypothetical protein
VTRAMKYSLNGKRSLLLFTDIASQTLLGLVGHLKTHFPAMYRLYLIMKNRTEPPTKDELAITSGEKAMDAEAASLYLGQVEVASSVSLLSMFAKQSQENVVSEMPYNPSSISLTILPGKGFRRGDLQETLSRVGCHLRSAI